MFVFSPLDRLTSVIRKLISAISVLTNAVGNITRSVGGTTGGIINKVFGFHDGGVVRQQDLTKLPGMASDEGLIRAQAGERVLTRDQQSQQQGDIIFQINAIDPRGTKEEIRQLIEEMQATGQLALG